jgi:hypothetical protein
MARANTQSKPSSEKTEKNFSFFAPWLSLRLIRPLAEAWRESLCKSLKLNLEIRKI